MDNLKRINPEIFEFIDNTLDSEADIHLKRALFLFYALLELVDRIEASELMPVEEKMLLFESFFLHLHMDEYSEEEDSDSLMYQMATIYTLLPFHYKRIIEETFGSMMTGLLKHLTEPKCSDWQDLMAYCHYEAGVPGIGLLRLLCEGGQEQRSLWIVRKHDMNALGTALQLVENRHLDPKESILPEGTSMDHLDQTIQRLLKRAGVVVSRLQSPLGRRLIAVPYLRAVRITQYKHGDCYDSWLIVISLAVLVYLIFRFIEQINAAMVRPPPPPWERVFGAVWSRRSAGGWWQWLRTRPTRASLLRWP